MNDERIHIGLQEILLAVLAVIAVVLAIFAMRPEAPPEVETTGAGAPSRDVTETSDPAQADPTGQPEAARPEALVGGLDASAVLVRASGGDCATTEGPLVLASTAPGAETVTAEVEEAVVATGLLVIDDESTRAISADADCAPLGLSTSDGGATWEVSDELPRFWSVLPGGEDVVQSPDGEVDVPCTPARASGIDAAVARVWCTDGKLLGTNTAGEAWATLGRTSSATDVAFTSAETGYALVERDECAGISIDRSTDGGTSWSTVHCVEGEGPWALAATRGRVAVVGVEESWSSVDGEEWERL